MIWLDLETFSAEPISSGVYKYAETARILLCAYAFDDAPALVYDATSGAPWPVELLRRLADPSEVIVAHNSNFDRTVLRRYLPQVGDPARWRDTMICAYSLSLPGSLADLCELCRLPVDKAKDADGKRLIRLFCRPQLDGSVLSGADRPDDWARFVNYCRLDVEAMRSVYYKLPQQLLPSDVVWSEWQIDQRINDRGMQIDLELVRAASAAAAAAKEAADQTVSRLTGGRAQSIGELDKLLEFCLHECGYSLPDMQRSTLEARLNDPALPPVVRDLLSARLSAGKASVKKYDALLACTNTDGRLRGCLQFMGAVRTGRWTGRLFQPQNLPRGTMSPEEVEEGIAALKSGLASVLYTDVTALVSNCLRAAICARPGHKLVVADLSNIEGRVLAWLAGESWKLEAFRAYDAGKGPDLYKVAYGRAFGIAPEDVTKKQRQIGKVMELAMGYQGGVGAFSTFARGYGVDLSEMARHVRESCAPADWLSASQAFARLGGSSDLGADEWAACEVIKRLWRRAHPAITGFWADVDSAVKQVLAGLTPYASAGRVSFRRCGTYLVATLPSGRPVCYPAARLPGEASGGCAFEYYGQIQATRRWSYIRTYAGKIVENLTQACARDVLASSLPAAEAAGYKTVLSVHDELITEVPDDPRFSAAGLAAIMSSVPSWAEGLPLSAAGFAAYRYKKD
jgi:DNA polymerase